ncbi:Pao retrotransposon peptidase superfamily [Paramuricea clavata]|uniref:Pao retrotransposon peptidase superfamily n=1 Tax=Paramuricea clavata TaxID=317549 RepID=A0A7D9HUX5_PARCT|nr:Pao retrotransposon peptidase superfamily [Paramuricea clavata]
MKPSKVLVANSKKDSTDLPANINLARCSTFWKTQRVMAQVQRFVALCKGTESPSAVMTVESLEKSKCVDRRSKLLLFTPYLDKNNGIRVGGRLDRTKLPYKVRHPIILPQKHRLTELIVNCYHRLENHGGVDHVLAAIRNKFWIIHGRQEKWKTEERNLSVNDVVIVFEPNLKPGEWKLGRILEVFPGNDGHVRAAKIKTSQGVCTRPITKLCVLEESKKMDDRRSQPDRDERW